MLIEKSSQEPPAALSRSPSMRVPGEAGTPGAKELMTHKYLSIEEAARRAGKGKFVQKLKAEVIRLFVEKGLLHGKKEKKRQLVADDDALARIMRLGVESFVYDQQGYSFMAVRAPIHEVAPHLRARPGVVNYDEGVKPRKLKKDLRVEPDFDVRHTFLVQMRGAPDWSVLLQTVHWFHSCDAMMGTALACVLSKEFQTLAAAAWDDDFSGSSLLVCEKGGLAAEVSDAEEGEGWPGFFGWFYEQGVYLPQSFIDVRGGNASLYVADPAEVQRADHVVLKLPRAGAGPVPHLFEKLGTMAEAMAEGLEDDEAFMRHMHEGVWRQAQAILTAGEL
jgi:hypothetical protein